MRSTYARLLADGRYEVGYVEIVAANRRLDHDVPVKVVGSLEDAIADGWAHRPRYTAPPVRS